MEKSKFLIVGLGNPGKAYEQTPHNIGFKVIDELAMRTDCVLRRSFRFKARLGKTMISDHDVLLVKPGCFMNNSGQAVVPVLKKRNIATQDMIVILDDADLRAGQLRVRAKGSGGGHKGLKSIIDNVGDEQFTRVRLGIGRSEKNSELTQYVLTPFNKKTLEKTKHTIKQAADAVVAVIEHGVESAMNQFN